MDPILPPNPRVETSGILEFDRPINVRDWILRFVLGNPFYPLSAGMMLYGIYLVSIEPQLAGQELSQLAFNASSLLLYQTLAVVTAIVLARRQIWYEAAMLSLLLHVFTFIPFILISQATLITPRVAASVCVATTGFVLLAYGGLRRNLKAMNLPAGILGIGFAFLVINLTLPIYFRNGLDLENDTWMWASPWLWCVLFPFIIATLNWLPITPRYEGPGLGRSWMPMATFCLWLVASIVHLWSIDYLDDRKFNYGKLAPILVALAWTLRHRIRDFVSDPSPALKQALLILPGAVSVIALAHPDTTLFMVLNLVNAVLYARVLSRENQPLHLILIPLTAAFAAIPDAWGTWIIPDFTRAKCVILSMGAYALFLASRSTHPRAGVAGAILAALGTQCLMDQLDYVEQFAMQHAFIYLLVHSLRWEIAADNRRAWRVAAGLAWIIHSFAWGYIVGLSSAWSIFLAGLLVFGFCQLWKITRGNWGPLTVRIASVATILTVPVNYVIALLSITPTGYLVVLGSFLLFALGTASALTKSRWSRWIEPPRTEPLPTSQSQNQLT